jgi:Ca-activated chloride channel family protein
VYESIVLLTDGENNSGTDPDQFLSEVKQYPPALKAVRTFSVLFGEASPQALKDVAEATGGQVFDGRTGNLATVFKEIRGYQ